MENEIKLLHNKTLETSEKYGQHVCCRNTTVYRNKYKCI